MKHYPLYCLGRDSSLWGVDIALEKKTEKELFENILLTNVSDDAAASICRGICSGFESGDIEKSLMNEKCLTREEARRIASAVELGRRFSKKRSGRKICSPQDAVLELEMYRRASKEHFLEILLNGAHESLGVNVVSVGTLTSTLVHPREVFAPAIARGAAAIIVAHNHPSGDTAPSGKDIKMTDILRKAGELLKIEVIDHIILGADEYFSFKEEDIIENSCPD